MDSILLFEKNKRTRELMTLALNAGMFNVATVRHADTAEKALAMLATDPVSAAVVDVDSIGMQRAVWLVGELARRHPETAIVLTSGREYRLSLEDIRPGVLRFMAHPFDLDRFRDVIRRSLEWHSGMVGTSTRSDTHSYRQSRPHRADHPHDLAEEASAE